MCLRVHHNPLLDKLGIAKLCHRSSSANNEWRFSFSLSGLEKKEPSSVSAVVMMFGLETV